MMYEGQSNFGPREDVTFFIKLTENDSPFTIMSSFYHIEDNNIQDEESPVFK